MYATIVGLDSSARLLLAMGISFFLLLLLIAILTLLMRMGIDPGRLGRIFMVSIILLLAGLAFFFAR